LKNVGIDAHLRSGLDDGKEFKTPTFTIDRPKGKKTLFIHGRAIGKKPEPPYPFLLCFDEMLEEAENDS
jgi:hypothetical protein